MRILDFVAATEWPRAAWICLLAISQIDNRPRHEIILSRFWDMICWSSPHPREKGLPLVRVCLDIDANYIADMVIEEADTSSSKPFHGLDAGPSGDRRTEAIHLDEALAASEMIEVWKAKGRGYSRRGERWAAESILNYALSLDKEQDDAWCELGIALHALGRFSEALCCFRRALALRSDNGVASERAAQAERQLQREMDGLLPDPRSPPMP